MKRFFILLNILFLSTGLLYSSSQPEKHAPAAAPARKGPPGSQVAVAPKPNPKATHRKDRKEEAPAATSGNEEEANFDEFEVWPTSEELQRQEKEEAAAKERERVAQEAMKGAATLQETQRAESYKQATTGQPTAAAALQMPLQPPPTQDKEKAPPKREAYRAGMLGRLAGNTGESWETDRDYVDAVIVERAAPQALKGEDFPTALIREIRRQAGLVTKAGKATVEAQKDIDTANNATLEGPATRCYQLLSTAQLPEGAGHTPTAASEALEEIFFKIQRELEEQARVQAAAIFTRINTLKELRRQIPGRTRDVSPDRKLTTKRS